MEKVKSGSMRQYVCNTWKELQIGKKIKFSNGFFETDDPELQHLIESRDGFGTSIHYQDTIEVMEARGRELAEKRANEKARRRQELLDELAAEDRDEKERLEKLAQVQNAQSESKANAGLLKAADKVANPEPADQQKTVTVEGANPQSAFGGIVGQGKGKRRDQGDIQ